MNLREPADYKDVFAVLTEAGYLPPAKLADFKKMAQFRNVIVHDYARIEPEILYAILQKNIEDLRLFAGVVRDSFL
ncbi:MAG: type VII toxin-antitoxin system HepT family RNase toxin [Desulfotomaculales bacterium]